MDVEGELGVFLGGGEVAEAVEDHAGVVGPVAGGVVGGPGDNADPLAVASLVGKRIAAVTAEFCTEGNCAPKGIESFDPAVIDRSRWSVSKRP